MRQGLAIVVPGDGYGLWQPGHVNDMAKGFVGALGKDITKGEAYNIVGDEVMTWRDFHERAAIAIGCEARIVSRTTEQIVAGAPKGQTDMLTEIFQYHAAYTNAKLKAHVPEFTGLLSWEDGVKDTVRWMDEVYAHRPAGEQPWIEGIVEKWKA
jgi:nucleoside-diphosphate-sugar epimerase